MIPLVPICVVGWHQALSVFECESRNDLICLGVAKMSIHLEVIKLHHVERIRTDLVDEMFVSFFEYSSPIIRHCAAVRVSKKKKMPM